MISKRDEHTPNGHLTCGNYSHTKDGIRYFELPENIGFNECHDAFNEAMSVERLGEISKEVSSSEDHFHLEISSDFFKDLAQAIRRECGFDES